MIRVKRIFSLEYEKVHNKLYNKVKVKPQKSKRKYFYQLINYGQFCKLKNREFDLTFLLGEQKIKILF